MLAALAAIKDRGMQKIYIEADDATGFEVPENDWENFPWHELSEEIEVIRIKIENDLGITLEKDGNVQDASFIEELRILNQSSYCSNGVICITPDIALRFSNYGKLFTLYSLTDSLEKYPVQEIKSIVSEKGWSFIDAKELDRPYDGKNIELQKAGITWWIRFFDYL